MKVETRKDVRYEQLKNFIDQYLDEVAHVSLWNEYCEKMNCYEDMIHSMSVIDDIYGRMFPTDLFKKLADGFNWNDDYFYIDRNGYLNSTDFPIDDIIEDCEIIAYMIENDEDFGYLAIFKILNDYDDTDETDE